LEGGKVAMLLQFTVGNFKSFKDKATLSLEATTDDWREDDNIAHIANPDLRFVKTAAIYGPNAGGKSNFIKAMVQFRRLILNSSKDSQKGEPIPVTPFRLSSATEDAPTFFEALFLKDGIRYRYGFEATKETIVSEWLYRQADSIRPTCLFTRENNSINPGDMFKEGKGLEERTRSNALFLSVVAQFNGSIAGEVMNCIRQLRALTGLSDGHYRHFTANLLSNKEYGTLIRELVRQADVGIEDLIKEDVDKDQFLEKLSKDNKDLPQAVRDLLAQSASGTPIVRTVHQRFDPDKRAIGKVEFDLASEESAGTQQFFALAGPFLHTLGEGAVLVVDELDARLHPLLTKQLVGLFNSSANRKNAQLIFATHDQGLLDQKQIRRDQIWFVEKDEMGASNLFSLDEIKGVRKDANFQKEYLLGQFGGVPHLGDFQKVIVNAQE
jgi:AAA15 family ATPase/GTPase